MERRGRGKGIRCTSEIGEEERGRGKKNERKQTKDMNAVRLIRKIDAAAINEKRGIKASDMLSRKFSTKLVIGTKILFLAKNF